MMDNEATGIDLTFDKGAVSKEDGTTDIVVTATLNGAVHTKSLSFRLVVLEGDPDGTGGPLGAEDAAARDVDYTITTGHSNNSKEKREGDGLRSPSKTGL